ncbi:NAD(P)-dependent dehydrogenase (short-subunit alcohol dehydrogenase family) [Microbacterium ginsengiterrae]|uniref:NAD(P)-dependent dehydrogenase (Short-subunit alcohol dehydrogenase family) n=1 Tax=Microbacterium ginsengiterrae TaxID=546115 RepID=A0A7W9FAE8_9MICO|nr:MULTISPECIES: SDR family oxidoreductase [Microbacterium]MBB5742196.1 NAD(P)-dependent dehydrogenase (short-subunit alcohol dehydrogenase family) [Microbacterium ginsengiterrae]
MTVTFPTERTVILTGAASPRGIGRGTAFHLAEQGWNVGIIDVDAEAAAGTAAEVAEAHGVRAVGVGADVADREQAVAAVDAIEAELPQTVALVNFAGVSSPVPYLEVTPEEWHRVNSINLEGVHWITQRVARTLAENRVGRIVGISSVSAQRGGGTFSKTPYSASKAGVIGLMRSIARELGPLGITANVISPGPIDTDIMGGTLTDERKAAMAADGVLPRIGTPTDIAAAVAYLISENAGFVTGQTLNVDGGLYMH